MQDASGDITIFVHQQDNKYMLKLLCALVWKPVLFLKTYNLPRYF